MGEFLFNYRFGDAEWGISILRSPDTKANLLCEYPLQFQWPDHYEVYLLVQNSPQNKGEA